MDHVVADLVVVAVVLVVDFLAALCVLVGLVDVADFERANS